MQMQQNGILGRALPAAALGLMLAGGAVVRGAPVSAGGGDGVYDIVVDGDLPYRVHMFTNTGPALLTVTNAGLVDVLVVAGGGGGGGGGLAGGGGAGGVILEKAYSVVASNYSVTVGAGGLGGYAYNLSNQAGVRGEDSAFGVELVAVGGGGGAGWTGHPSSSGGSGGGGNSSVAASPGTDGQGHAGNIGSGTTAQRSGGGGGGAGEPGGLGLAGAGGKGGDGIAVFGDYYGGGGGGGLEGTTLVADGGGAGGLGGGGAGSKGSTRAMDASPNTGGGGGGAGYNTSSTGRLGGNGGSGVVIVRYPLSAVSATDRFTLANIVTGSERFTNTNKVNVAAFPVPAGYDQFQWTGEAGTLDALNPGAWLATNAIADLMAAPVAFNLPTADTNVMLYAWFTNTTDTAAPLMRAAGSICFTREPPRPAVHSPLARSIVGDRPSIVLTLAEIDNASAGGEACGLPIPVFGTPVIRCPDDQTPGAPDVTLGAAGTFAITLTLTNEAGNVASAVSEVSVTTRDAELYVSLNGDQSTGTDWASAYTNIQAALDAAVSNDTIYLAGQTFALASQLVWTQSFVRVLGGYAATNAAEQPGPRDPEQWPTVITRDPAYETRLLFVDGTENAEIAGITFTDGRINFPNAVAIDMPGGGAIAIRNASKFSLRDVRLAHHYLRNRSGGAYGGALHVANSTGVISNTFFMANEVVGSATVGYGGAVNLSGGAVHLRDIVVLANRSRGEWASESSRCGFGGGLSFNGGSHSLSNALLFLNQSRRHVLLTATEGSGIYVWNNATVAIANTTIAGHSSDGLYIDSGDVTLRNSILAGNSPDIVGAGTLAISDCLVGDGSGGGTVNILVGDPGFDEEWFYLASDSSCRQAGSGTVAAAGLAGYTVSTNGEAEIATDSVSMGYHYPPGSALEAFREVYVSADTGDDNASGDDAHPFQTLARALQASTGRLRVHLMPGVYDDAAEFPLKVSERATLQIVGADPPTTIIDGKNAANKRMFELFCAFGNNGIRGVTLRNAGGTVPALDGLQAGGAIHLSRSRLTIRDCIITNNRASVGSGAITLGIQMLGGGAIGAKQAALAINDSVLAGNTTTWGSGGGAILALATVGGITGCVFSNNIADAQTGPVNHNRSMTGGALHLGRSSLEILNCRFTGNQAISHRNGNSAGGALFHCDGRVTVRNCLFADNLVTNNYTVYPLYGAAAYQHNTSYLSSTRTGLTLENCTVFGNTGDGGDYGHGVYGNDAYMRVVNTILLDNLPFDFANLTAAAFSHCRADRLVAGEQGNINADPLLIDAPAGNYGLRTLTGQYTAPGGSLQRYSADSPCIDAGTNLVWMTGATDLRGFPRRAHGLTISRGEPKADMGVFEVRIPPPGSLFMIR